MSKINHIISEQNYEFIGKRIFDVLFSEFDAQFYSYGDYDCDVSVFLERSTPIDKSEFPAVVVSFAKGTFGNKNQGSIDGMPYVYHVDVYASAVSKEGVSGDMVAALLLNKLLGKCRAILEDPVYKTLGIKTPMIIKTIAEEMDIAASNKEDATNTSMGRIAFKVWANETSKLIVPELIEGYTTSIKINGSGKGYFYEGENY